MCWVVGDGEGGRGGRDLSIPNTMGGDRWNGMRTCLI